MKESKEFKHSGISDKVDLYKIIIIAKCVEIFSFHWTLWIQFGELVMWNERKLTKTTFWTSKYSILFLINLRNIRQRLHYEENSNLVLQTDKSQQNTCLTLSWVKLGFILLLKNAEEALAMKLYPKAFVSLKGMWKFVFFSLALPSPGGINTMLSSAGAGSTGIQSCPILSSVKHCYGAMGEQNHVISLSGFL